MPGHASKLLSMNFNNEQARKNTNTVCIRQKANCLGCAPHLLLQFCIHSIKLFLEGLLGLRSLDFEGGRHHPIFYGKWLWMQMYCCDLQFAYTRSVQRLASDILMCQKQSTKVFLGRSSSSELANRAVVLSIDHQSVKQHGRCQTNAHSTGQAQT